MRYNSQYFDIKHKDLLYKFLDLLIKQSEKDDLFYNDIHIRMDDAESVILEWSQVDWENKGDFGKFEFVDSDQRVMTQCTLPDNSYVMCYDEDEVKQTLENWEKEHSQEV